MKKRFLAVVLSLSAAIILSSLPVFSVSAKNLLPGFDETKTRVVFENPHVTEGTDYAWQDVHTNYVTVANGEMTVEGAASVIKRMYWRPNSAYGSQGAFGEGGVAIKMKFTFQEAAADTWGVMLAIRNTSHTNNPVNNLSLCFYKNKVVLSQANSTGNPTQLAVLDKALEDAYYNIEFITLDSAVDGTTTAYVLITDEEGRLLLNDGDTGDFTMKAENITGLSSGFISMYDNGTSIRQFSMKEGSWTYSGRDDEPTEIYPSLKKTRCYDFEELDTTTSLYEYWANVTSPLDYTVNAADKLVEVTSSSTSGLYYKPCSTYNEGLQDNVALAMTLGIDFIKNARDWGQMIILKGDVRTPSWTLGRGVVLMMFSDKIVLYKVVSGKLEALDTYQGSLNAGENYNLEFIAMDNEEGTTDAYVKITDKAGKILKNTGNTTDATLSAAAIEGVAGKGYVSIFSYEAAVSKYRIGKGVFTNKNSGENGTEWSPSTNDWLNKGPTVGDYDYSFAVVGDTQMLTRDYHDKLGEIYKYIRQNAADKKIKFAFGLGDITYWNSSSEWEQAKREIHTMDGVVPYSLNRGNHESIAGMNQYFPYGDYKDVLGGSYNGGIENTWQELKTEKLDYLIFSLDYGPSDAVLNWASKIIEEHPHHNVIITTHAYLYHDGTLYDDKGDTEPTVTGGYNNGDDIWEKLVSKHSNIVLVLCGHDPNDSIVKTVTNGVNGNKVTQMLINPEGVDNGTVGGAGMVAMFYFSEGGSKVQVEYYSTVRKQWYKDSNQFIMDLSVVEKRETGGSEGEGNDSSSTQAPQTGEHLPTGAVAGLALSMLGILLSGAFVLYKKRV